VPETLKTDWRVTKNGTDLGEYLRQLEDAEVIAIDTEGTGLKVRDLRDHATGIGTTIKVNGKLSSHFFPFRFSVGFNYNSRCLEELRRILQKTTKRTVFHNALYDLPALRTLGINIPTSPILYDTMLISSLVNENWPLNRSLDSLAFNYLGLNKVEKTWRDEDWAWIPADVMYEYAVWDPEVTYMVWEHEWQKVEQIGLHRYWEEHKSDTIHSFDLLMQTGVQIDESFCERKLYEGSDVMADVTELLGGKPTGAHLKKILLDELGLPVVKTTPNGRPSFDKEAMQEYDVILQRVDNPIAEWVKAYRGWEKATSSMFKAYLDNMSPDGRLRTNYMLHKAAEGGDAGGTVTGRVSSRNPNLQQIPRNSSNPWNGDTKKAFKASDGMLGFEIDYSQLELRLGTHYAQDAALIDAFEHGRDVFTEMAKELGMPRHEVKTMVYSIQYGAGLQRLMNVFGINKAQAADRKLGFFGQYPGFKSAIDLATREAFATKRVKIWSGRYRNFANVKAEAHKAFNSRIQGGAADIVEVALNQIVKEVIIPSDGAVRVMLQIHDAFCFEAERSVAESAKKQIAAIMTGVGNGFFRAKFDVDTHDWGSNGN